MARRKRLHNKTTQNRTTRKARLLNEQLPIFEK
jgi:hypothetical protein